MYLQGNRKEGKIVPILTEKDILDGTKISVFFSKLSDEGKAMAIGYLSALRDKEVSTESKEMQEA